MTGAATVSGPRPVAPGRTGVFGGTFDPVHMGHLAAAEEAREALGLERVLFVPAGEPWQKAGQTISAGRHRMAMIELAIAASPSFEASGMELERTGPSYTVDTLEALGAAARDEGRAPDLWFILSAEALRGLPTWREPRRVLELSRLAVVPRPARHRVGEALGDGVAGAGLEGQAGGDGDGDRPPDRAWLSAHFPGLEDRVTFLDRPRLDISGTDLRARLRAGRSVRYLVPDAVVAYIGDHDLYRHADRRIERS